MGEKNNGILEKTSPNSPFIIHHSSLPLSPLLLNSFVLHFFKRLNSYKIFKKTTEATEITEVTEIAEGEI